MEPKSTPPANPGHPCDHGRIPALVAVRPLRITAGSSGALAPLRAMRLALAGEPKPIIRGLPGYNPVVVCLDWPDGSTPNLDASDWQWLLKRLRATGQPLHVNCLAGHGRTGTALAIIGHFLRIIPGPKDSDPVAWVRDIYCDRAVETRSQIMYIEAMTGRPVKVAPRPMATPPTPKGKTGDYGGYSYPKPGADYPISGGRITREGSTRERPGDPNLWDDLGGYRG